MMQSSGDDASRAPAPIRTGTQIQQYVIRDQIGSGAMGEVYLADDTALDRLVTLKFLGRAICSEAACRDRFVREARAAAKLNHPCIVTIHEVAEWNSRPYIVMEYIDGPTLEEPIRENGLDLQQKLHLIIDISGGLKEAHDKGVIHRDLKPSNILLDRRRRPRIVDFGLATIRGAAKITRTGTTLGTMGYISPEQLQGRDLDARSDLFSLGVIFYELLTGQMPFRGDYDAAIIYAILQEQPVPLAEYIDSVPEYLQSVIDRLLAKDPADRYQSADLVIEDLSRYVTGSSTDSMSTPVRVVSPALKTLAVLHLANRGPAEDDFICYGITEDLIVDLTRLGAIRVTPMRAIMKYKDSDAPVEDIARALKADIILDGSIFKTGKSIRVTAELVDVSSGTNLWANRWEETQENLSSVKKALADGVVEALQIVPQVASRAGVGHPEATNPDAYEFYLRGKYVFEHMKDATDVEVALGFFRQALSTEPTLSAARSGMAAVHIHRGEYRQAEKQLQAALASARERELAADEQETLRLLAELHQKESKWDAALEQGRQALEIARRLGDLAGEEQILTLLISVHQLRADFDAALEHYGRIIEITEQVGDEYKLGDAMKSAGNVHFRKGEYARARELYEQALGIARRHGHVHLEAKCVANVGLTLMHSLRLDESLECYESALRLYRKVGDQVGVAICFNNMALVYSAQGQYRKSIEAYERAASIHDGLGNRSDYALARSNLARLKAVIGQEDEAIRLLQEALAIAEELDYPFVVNVAHDSLGDTYVCMREFDKAEKHFRKAMTVAESASLRRETALAQCGLAYALWYRGDYAQAREVTEQAHALATELEEEFVQLRTNVLRAALRARTGEFGVVIRELEAAAADVRRLGDARYTLEAQVLLGQLLLERGPDSAARDRGREILSASLQEARQKDVTYLVAWIGSILDSGASGS